MPKERVVLFSFILIAALLSSCDGILAGNADGLGIGSSQISPVDGMVMMYVPAGAFTMGWNGGKPDEQPEHRVYLDAFWIDQTEVTVGQYRKCVEAGVCGHPQQGVHHMRNSSEIRRSYYDNEDYFDYPVIFVNWSQAQTYCEWAGGRRNRFPRRIVR